MRLTGVVLEKWSEKPVPDAIVWVGNQELLTDENGRFSIDVPLGAILIKISKEGYKEGAFSLQAVSDTEFTLLIEPLFRTL